MNARVCGLVIIAKPSISMIDFPSGFAVTVMLSFPLIVFPCRVSINSLLFPEKNTELHVTTPIPQGRFVAITAGVMSSTLVLAILIPNSEYSPHTAHDISVHLISTINFCEFLKA